MRKVHDDIEDSPSPTQSHSDTTRSQLSRVANEITKVIESRRSDAEIISRAINANDPQYSEIVEVWAVVEIQGAAESSWYIILPISGGDEIEFEGLLITVIGLESPLAMNSMGKSIGDEFSIGEQSFWISDIF